MENLVETKRRLSRKYLGSAGIHGIGKHDSDQAIQVDLKEDDSPEQREVLRQIELEAAPYKVEIRKLPRMEAH